MSKEKRYTEEEFVNAVNISNSIKGVLELLGLKPAGGNYDIVKRKIKELGLVTNFIGRGWPKGKKREYKGKSLKKLMMEEFKFEGVCGNCNTEQKVNVECLCCNCYIGGVKKITGSIENVTIIKQDGGFDIDEFFKV